MSVWTTLKSKSGDQGTYHAHVYGFKHKEKVGSTMVECNKSSFTGGPDKVCGTHVRFLEVCMSSAQFEPFSRKQRSATWLNCKASCKDHHNVVPSHCPGGQRVTRRGNTCSCIYPIYLFLFIYVFELLTCFGAWTPFRTFLSSSQVRSIHSIFYTIHIVPAGLSPCTSNSPSWSQFGKWKHSPRRRLRVHTATRENQATTV